MRLGYPRLHGRRSSWAATPIPIFLAAIAAGSCAAPADEPVQAVAQPDHHTNHPGHPSAPALDIGRSLAIVDLPTLEATDAHGQRRFSLYRVLDQIAATSKASHRPSAAEMYKRIFDTNNTKADGLFHDGQHCDDRTDASGQALLNGFPLECPRQERVLTDFSEHDPFCSDASDHPVCDPYTPIAIVNRFDLAPANGQTCGQYRIVFGKGVGQEPLATAGNHDHPFNRTLMIFESVLRNPHPGQGLAGCADEVEMWAGLSAEPDPAKRAAKLDHFFFDGLEHFGAAIDFDNYTGEVDPHTGVQMSGQIRCNQFMFDLEGQPWQLREYNTARRCGGGDDHHGDDDDHGNGGDHHGNGDSHGCTAQIRLVVPKVNPDASLFDDHNHSAAARSFRDAKNPAGFISQVQSLATPDLNLLNMNGLSAAYDGAQSTSSPLVAPDGPAMNDSNYNVVFDPTGHFASKIQAELDRIGSTLTPTEIVRRAQTQACAGCHELATKSASFFGGAPPASPDSFDSMAPQIGGGLVWPEAALGAIPINSFTQTSEVLLVPLPGYDGPCDTTCAASPTTCQCAWDVSPALRDVFLPFRAENMTSYLAKVYADYGPWSLADSGPKAATMCGSPDN